MMYMYMYIVHEARINEGVSTCPKLVVKAPGFLSFEQQLREVLARGEKRLIS